MKKKDISEGGKSEDESVGEEREGKRRPFAAMVYEAMNKTVYLSLECRVKTSNRIQ